MITVENVLLPDLRRLTIHHQFPTDVCIDGSDLLALPGLIDAHVHFRTPGMSSKENWSTASKAAILGGLTTVLDMPNNIPPTNTMKRLFAKKKLIDQQLQRCHIPIRYGLYYGIHHRHLHELGSVKQAIVALKIFLGSKTHPLFAHEQSVLHSIYALAATHGLMVAVHAEDRQLSIHKQCAYQQGYDYSVQSKIITAEQSAEALEFAIQLCELYQVPTYLLHISSRLDLELVRTAKAKGLPLYAETCPQYLFFNEQDYAQLQGRGKLNPPLRTKTDMDDLWIGLIDGTIDVLSSDHAPHELALKSENFAACPTGMPGIETMLPLMITAWKQGRIGLERIVKLLHDNPKKIFHLHGNEDLVLVNIADYHVLDDTQVHYKCRWTAYQSFNLTGFPRYVFVNGLLLDCRELAH